jgi:alpha-tubulin suppressor-like RCC1 family protein
MKSPFLFLVLCLALVGCKDIFGPDGKGEYPQLWVRQTGVILDVGQESQLSAKIHRGPRELVEDAAGARWWTDDGDVLRVDGSGSITALAPGRATVWVQLKGARDSGTVVVRGSTPEYRTRWASVEVGEESTCALTTDMRAYCWGSDYFGAIGDGVRRQWTLTYAPVKVSGGHTFAEVDVGRDFACGRTAAGDAFCWGDAMIVGTRRGQEEHVLSPAHVRFSQPFTQLRTGDGHICGLVENGRAYCWGINAHGEIGDGTVGIDNHRYVPTPVQTDLRFEEIVPGHYKTCALAQSGAAYCWGMSEDGRLGTGRIEGDRPLPTPVARGHEVFQSLTGQSHTCGTTREGTVHCWGPNRWLQLGYAPPDDALAPVLLDEPFGFERVFAGTVTTCGVSSVGRAYCWGWNQDGNLGTEVPVTEVCGGVDQVPCSKDPLPVSGNFHFVQISASMTATCGITVDGALYCWGSNEFGQLGNGSLVESSPIPVRVADPL